MKVNGYTFPWWLVLFLAFSAVVAIASIYFLLTVTGDLANSNQYFQTPFTYKLVDYEKTELCPGDMLNFEYEVLVPSTGAFVSRITETWTLPSGQHIVFEETPYFVNQIGPVDLVLKRGAEVPELLPGEYEYRRAGALPPSSGRPAFMVVPFVVAEGCK